MESNKFSNELKEQVLKECRKTGNIALLVARKPNTVHRWRKNSSETKICQIVT